MDKDRCTRRQALRGRMLGGLLDTVGRTLQEVQKGLTPTPASSPRPASPPPLPVLHRPPGAIEESTFLADCTRCDACLRACPADAITHADPCFGRAAGTPVIEPTIAACTMCVERACVTACQIEGTGVLSPLLEPRMGTARIHPSRCVVYHGQQCEACFEACPVEGALTERGRQPGVDASLCVGCGMCLHACPTEPRAISIIPTRERPPRPS